MATYVTSDAHGHLRAFSRALELAHPGSQDTLYVIGDMIDRGPAPVGVMKLVRQIPHVRVLMGNHERMMLDALGSKDFMDTLMWQINGGGMTSKGLDELPKEELVDIVEWVRGLALYDIVTVDDLTPSARPGAKRTYILVHAGIDALALRGYLATAGVSGEDGYGDVPEELLRDAMDRQDPEDLVWIRERFWGVPTGLVGADGRGPIVIAGHTPSVLLGSYATLMSGTGANEDGRGCMVDVGCTADTGGVPDRIDIDCSAAAGYPQGRVGVMRLEDRHVWYADIGEDD